MVIIPIHKQRALGPVTETRKRSVGNRGYMDLTEKNYLNWGALPPSPPFRWGGFAPPHQGVKVGLSEAKILEELRQNY